MVAHAFELTTASTASPRRPILATKLFAAFSVAAVVIFEAAILMWIAGKVDSFEARCMQPSVECRR
jgi:hypothetical protein